MEKDRTEKYLESYPDMVFRVMGYDYTSYRSQINSKSERRYPVISAVLYFGRTPWEQPCTIKQAIEIPEGYEQAVSDYKIHVKLY